MSIPIRSLKIVVDIEDPFNPELPLDKFCKIYGTEPEPPRFRVITIDTVACPQDGFPVLATECGLCPGFIRRMGGRIYCRKATRSSDST
jgi:hypothetical protein